ncbi:Csu type fimbrial protein [Paraburkholderia elongata]|uniref:Fimbrial major subunit CsuA/B family protein n=1 Tax=Paraburkholderia elongata TaxID=2675747 RepID=A0A972NYV6_9BURK|nr:spore coat U domain-containing protein [Paraburkholderia elongata]NPT61402.1 fimbrial major subunit CsuA/B family protein [Paraburkholderia elongata]
MKKLALMHAAIAAVFLSGAAGVSAASTTTTFGVSATVNASCVIDSADALTFSAFIPGSGAQAATSAVKVRCTNNTAFNIGLDAGGSAGATVASRIMKNGTNTLTYSLYRDSGHQNVWGNTVNTDTLSGTGAGMASANTLTETVYGQIPDQPNAVPGAYADTVTVTVSF